MLAILIPVKGRGKERLSNMLNVEGREKLILYMLKLVLKACYRLGDVFVISKDEGVLEMAKAFKVKTLYDPVNGLNDAIIYAQYKLKALGYSQLLVLPVDLPLLKRQDVESLIEKTSKLRPPFAVIAPSKDEGTNALFLSPPDAIKPSFGPDSFKKHIEQALGIDLHVFRSEGFEFDVDVEEDLLKLIKLKAEVGKLLMLSR